MRVHSSLPPQQSLSLEKSQFPPHNIDEFKNSDDDFDTTRRERKNGTPSLPSQPVISIFADHLVSPCDMVYVTASIVVWWILAGTPNTALTKLNPRKEGEEKGAQLQKLRRASLRRSRE